MPKIAYVERKLSAGSLAIVARANEIIGEYQAKGFVLTLRQLYYQFVARGIIANKQTEYKRLGSIVNDARLAGLIDWHAIEDRTRNLHKRPAWDSPADIIESAASSYHRDLWQQQPYRPEVWIEKDALLGVIEGVCEEFDVPFFGCRGYSSQSEQWRAARRFAQYRREGKRVVLFHLGDHDPSGIDMTRDNRARIVETFGVPITMKRLALNMPQIEDLKPPPNPAKTTDSRFEGYVREYGEESWELDALPPEYIARLIREEIEQLIDEDRWAEAKARVEEERAALTAAAERWDDVVAWLRNGAGDDDAE